MKLFTNIFYSLIIVFYIADARVKREVDSVPVTKYYLDASRIVMECVPPQGSSCHWAAINTGNQYFMQSLPTNVESNSSDSCTITLIRPSMYHNQIWACQMEGDGTTIATYRIKEGFRPTAPKFKNDGGFLSLQDNVDWSKLIEINCSTVLEGIPPPIYNINVTGIQNIKKVTNNSVILEPAYVDTDAKLTCKIEQQFLPNPLTTTIRLQLQDKPKILGEPVSSFDSNLKEQIFKYTFISIPRLNAYEWTFSNSSDKNSHQHSVDKEERYTSLKVFQEEKGQSLLLTIKGFNDTDKSRFFYLKLSNAKGSIQLGPLNSAVKDSGDVSLSKIIAITIGTLGLLVSSILLAYFLYRKNFSSVQKFLVVGNEERGSELDNYKCKSQQC